MNTQKYRDFDTNHQTSDKFHGTVLTTISFSLIFITHSEKSQPDFQELLRLILETGIGKIHTQRISLQTLTSRSGRGSLSSVCAYRFCRTSVCKQAKNGTHAFFAPKRHCSRLPKPLRTSNRCEPFSQKGAFMVKKWMLIGIFSVLSLACSGENGASGKDATVNVDSLANVIRSEITGTLWDSLYAKPYIDTVYNALFNNAFSSSWMDSTREALIDSLKRADYDSLYAKLYDSVYYDIYSQSVIKYLEASSYTVKEDIYTAFANQYPLMYKNFTKPYPISIRVRNECQNSYFSATPCSYKKILVKAWVDNFSDTGSVTDFVNPDTSEIFAPQIRFKPEKYLDLKAPAQAQFQVRAYALENDHEVLFYASSEPTTIHPVQINGAEYQGVENRNWWWAVWVTPGMDSLQNILDELSAKLPDGTVKVYQKYSADKNIAASSKRVVQAVFEVLQSRQINYVQNNGAGSRGQKINYPIEVLRSRGGLCIETTALFASILEALGMQAFIVSVPGHAFVGWRVDEDSDTLDFVETTLIGSKTSTFKYANSSAIDRYNEEVDAGTFESGESELIDIEKVRRYGIMPNDIP